MTNTRTIQSTQMDYKTRTESELFAMFLLKEVLIFTEDPRAIKATLFFLFSYS